MLRMVCNGFLLAQPERLRVLSIWQTMWQYGGTGSEGIRIATIAFPQSLDRQLFNSLKNSDFSIKLERE